MYYLPSIYPSGDSAHVLVRKQSSQPAIPTPERETLKRARAALAELGLELKAGHTQTGWEIRQLIPRTRDGQPAERVNVRHQELREFA
jgi:hypothetical protein